MEPSLSCLGRLRRCWSCWLSKVVVMWSCKTLKALWGPAVRWFLVGGQGWPGREVVANEFWTLNMYGGNIKVDNLCYIGCLDPIPTTRYQQERKLGTTFKCRQTGALPSEFAMCLCVRSCIFLKKSRPFWQELVDPSLMLELVPLETSKCPVKKPVNWMMDPVKSARDLTPPKRPPKGSKLVGREIPAKFQGKSRLVKYYDCQMDDGIDFNLQGWLHSICWKKFLSTF